MPCSVFWIRSVDTKRRPKVGIVAITAAARARSPRPNIRTACGNGAFPAEHEPELHHFIGHWLANGSWCALKMVLTVLIISRPSEILRGLLQIKILDREVVVIVLEVAASGLEIGFAQRGANFILLAHVAFDGIDRARDQHDRVVGLLAVEARIGVVLFQKIADELLVRVVGQVDGPVSAPNTPSANSFCCGSDSASIVNTW